MSGNLILLVEQLAKSGLIYNVHYCNEDLEYGIEQIEKYGKTPQWVCETIKGQWNDCCNKGDEIK